MDGDGFPDIFSVSPTSQSKFFVHYGDGSGDFGDKREYSFPSNYNDLFGPLPDSSSEIGFRDQIVINDFNGDGVIDFLRKAKTTGMSSTPYIFFGTGDRTSAFESKPSSLSFNFENDEKVAFSDYMTFNNIFADFNNDGNIDILRGSGKTKPEAINECIRHDWWDTPPYESLSDYMQKTWEYPTDPNDKGSRLMCKYSRAQYLDSYSGNISVAGMNTLELYLGKGNGSFSEVVWKGEDLDNELNFYDKNKCLVSYELAFMNSLSDERVICETKTGRNLSSFRGISHNVTVADVNGDGFQDIVIGGATGTVYFKNDGKGLFSEKKALTQGTDNAPLVFAKVISDGLTAYNKTVDFDGDGLTDFLVASQAKDNSMVYFQLEQYSDSTNRDPMLDKVRRVERIVENADKSASKVISIDYAPISTSAASERASYAYYDSVDDCANDKGTDSCLPAPFDSLDDEALFTGYGLVNYWHEHDARKITRNLSVVNSYQEALRANGVDSGHRKTDFHYFNAKQDRLTGGIAFRVVASIGPYDPSSSDPQYDLFRGARYSQSYPLFGLNELTYENKLSTSSSGSIPYLLKRETLYHAQTVDPESYATECTSEQKFINALYYDSADDRTFERPIVVYPVGISTNITPVVENWKIKKREATTVWTADANGDDIPYTRCGDVEKKVIENYAASFYGWDDPPTYDFTHDFGTYYSGISEEIHQYEYQGRSGGVGSVVRESTKIERTKNENAEVIRETVATFNPKGRLEELSLNPGDLLSVTETIQYDDVYGYMSSTTKQGWNGSYDEWGQVNGNALGKRAVDIEITYEAEKTVRTQTMSAGDGYVSTTSSEQDIYSETPVSETDVGNAITMSRSVDRFGRISDITNTDDSEKVITYSHGCAGEVICRDDAYYRKIETVKDKNGSVVDRQEQRFDIFDRLITQITRNYGGSDISTQYYYQGNRLSRITSGSDNNELTVYDYEGNKFHFPTFYESQAVSVTMRRPQVVGLIVLDGSTQKRKLALSDTALQDEQYREVKSYISPTQSSPTTYIDTDKKLYFYDNVGRIVQTTDSNAPDVLKHEYHPYGGVMRSEASNTTVVSYYDNNGNKITMADPVVGTWSYRYNAFGELIWQKDARDVVITNVYDDLGRMSQRIEGLGKSDQEVIAWEYYTNNSTNGKGKLHRVTKSLENYEKEYTYDIVGRIQSEKRIVDEQEYLITYTYDDAGRMETKEYPVYNSNNGSRIKIKYNYQNNYLHSIVEVSASNKLLWKAVSRDVYGRVTKHEYGSGFTDKVDFVENSSNIERIYTRNANNAIVYDRKWTWGYDTLSQYKIDDNTTINYYYDERYRIEAAEYNHKNSTDCVNGCTSKFEVDIDSDDNIRTIGTNYALSDVYNFEYANQKPNQVSDIKKGEIFYSAAGVPDFNQDGAVDSKDFLYVREKILADAQNNLNADCNEDSRLDVRDLGCAYKQIREHRMNNSYEYQYDYDENGNVILAQNGFLGGFLRLSVKYNYANRTSFIGRHPEGSFLDTNTKRFDYDENGRHYRSEYFERKDGQYYIENVNRIGEEYESRREEYYTEEGETRVSTSVTNTYKHYIQVGPKLAAMILVNDAGEKSYYYITTDYQNSVVGIHSDGQTDLSLTMEYGIYGSRAKQWWKLGENGPSQVYEDNGQWDGAVDYGTDIEQAQSAFVINRGYTGHEMLDEFALINMKGRIFDPNLGRFLQPDPTIPDMTNPQAYNRYSYVYNSPTHYTDPTGYNPVSNGYSEGYSTKNWTGVEFEGDGFMIAAGSFDWFAGGSSSVNAAVGLDEKDLDTRSGMKLPDFNNEQIMDIGMEIRSQVREEKRNLLLPNESYAELYKRHVDDVPALKKLHEYDLINIELKATSMIGAGAIRDYSMTAASWAIGGPVGPWENARKGLSGLLDYINNSSGAENVGGWVDCGRNDCRAYIIYDMRMMQVYP